MTHMETAGDPRSAAFARLEGAAGSGLRDLRRAALQRFQELGFPTLHWEAWRNTDVSALARTVFRAAAELPAPRLPRAALEPYILPGAEALLVFVNGRFAPELSRSTPWAQPLGAALRQADGTSAAHLGHIARFESHPFTALNTALFEDGACVRIPRGQVVNGPIQIVFMTVTDAEAAAPPLEAHPRLLVVAEENSQADLVETWAGIGTGVHFDNAVTEIVLQDHAVLSHCKLQIEPAGAFHVATLQAQVGRGARFASCSLALGAALARNEVNALLAGEGAECSLDGLYLLGGRQHSDQQTFVDHAQPHCSSTQLYKGILGGASRGVFNGRVLVRKDAQKTDAHQTNRNLLLSTDALIDTKPQLEIYADDVKCTHGATIGRLDEDEVFYLRARGIDAEAARSILTHAFAREVLGRVRVGALRESVGALVDDRLGLDSRTEAGA